MVDKKVERKNRILGLILFIIALASTIGAVVWFSIYAPLIIK
jgi:hypothetical protein